MAALPEETTAGNSEEGVLDVYPPFFVACGALIAVTAVVFGLFPQSPGHQAAPMYAIAIISGLFAIGWYRWVNSRPVTQNHLGVATAAYLALVVLLVFSGRDLNSPFIFLTLPPLVLAGITLTVGPTLVLALSTVIGLLGVMLINSGISLQVTAFWWTALASFVVVAGMSGVLGQVLRRHYRSLEEAKTRAVRFSNVDELTGLNNRRHLDALLPQEVERARRHARPLALLMVDSDHLKEVNDTHGHQAGDQLLKTIAQVISEQIRLVDTAIRFGGDEFIVILPETDVTGALIPADRIRAVIAERPIESRGEQVLTTASVGVAAFPESADDSLTLLERVDKALYASKHGGRNRVTAYSDDLVEVGAPAD